MSELERRNDFRARIAELEARLKLERDAHAEVQRNLVKRIAKLEAQWAHTVDALRAAKAAADESPAAGALL